MASSGDREASGMDKEEGQNEVRRGGPGGWAGKEKEGEACMSSGRESAETRVGVVTGTRGAASQVPILLITLEDFPEGFQSFWGKQVDAAVDDVAHESARLLHIVQDLKVWC